MHYTSPDVYEFISKQTSDPIVERKTCRISGTPFPIFQSDLTFYDTVSPTFAGKKYAIPTPTHCPEERARRRMLFRNERKLYKRKCDATGETIISIYAPNSDNNVYGYTFWLGDERNPLAYGIKYDTEQPSFFYQFGTLTKKVPSKSLVSEYNENCDYTSICGYCKDCYMTTASEYSQNCMYGYLLQTCEHVYDASSMFSCSVCYEGIDMKNCHQCFSSNNLKDCSFCYGCEQLYNCTYCINCHGLSGKSYCIDNEQVTKEAYMHYLKTYTPSGYSTFPDLVQPAMNSYLSENVYGDAIIESSDIILGYEIERSESIKYSQVIVEGKDLVDCSNCYVGGEKSYEVMSSLHTYNNLFCGFIYNCSDCLYSLNCNNSHHLFACSNLNNKQYCIFNKQYTKETYEQEVAKIIEHMQNVGERGEFFHPSLSPFGYNETVAQEYFPLHKEEAIGRGYKRQEITYDPVIPENIETLTGEQITSDINQVDDSILKKILICEVSGRPYRVIKQELEFYRKHDISLPRKHPDIRHQERAAKKAKREIHLRTCDKTGENILSVYSPDASFKVYSNEIYQQEIFG